jgi:hypothetical protein
VTQLESCVAQQGAAWISRVRRGSVGCGMAQQGAVWLNRVRRGAAVRRPRVRISSRHPSGGPILIEKTNKEWLHVTKHKKKNFASTLLRLH